MATEYDLKLVVDADTSEAQRKLDALGGGRGGGARQPTSPSAPGARQPSSPSAPGATPTGPAGGSTRVPSPAAREAAERVRGERARVEGGKDGGRSAGEFGRAAGDVAGRMIGKAVAGFVAHQLASTVFAAMKTPGGDNRNVNMAEAAVGGAMQYGTMGAMLGGPVGAAVGGLAGAIAGLAQEAIRQKKAVEARDLEIDNANYARARDTPIRASDQAFSQSLEMAGGWRQRVAMLRARRDEIANGDGKWSVRSLEKELKGVDPESAVSQRLMASLETQKNRVAALDAQLVQEGLPWQPGRLDAGSVTDSWAKRGIGIGASVDVSQVNDRIMSEVQDCRRLLEKIAGMGTDRLHTVEAIQRTVFE